MYVLPLVMGKGSFSGATIRIISYVRSRTLVLRVCDSYLAYDHYVRGKSPFLDSIFIICDFSDVFRTNLPSLFHKCQIEFPIDIKLGTQPISMAPYRMAPV